MSIIAVSGTISDRDATLIKAVVAGIMPEVSARLDGLRTENKALADRIAELEARKPETGPPGEKGEKGEPGQDAPAPSLDALWSEFQPQVGELLAEAVSRAVEALPKPERGEKGDPGERGEKGEVGQDGANGADGRDGKDAAGIVEALKDDGELVLTLQDGRLVRTGIRDGEKGKDGRDGFEIDDYDEWFEDDGRILVRQFVRGEDCKQFRHQTSLPIDRGVFKQGQTYHRGDVTTWGGSAWIAQKETDAKPDTADSGWRLCVKRGRDGKDAK